MVPSAGWSLKRVPQGEVFRKNGREYFKAFEPRGSPRVSQVLS